MAPPDDGDATGGAGGSKPYVYCPECGKKASTDWSFCRSCEASLRDFRTTEGRPTARNDGEEVGLAELVDEDTGCPKCGYTDAEVDDVVTTENGAARLLAVQSRRFRAVSCTRCGYTEFYRERSRGEALDLFVR